MRSLLHILACLAFAIQLVNPACCCVVTSTTPSHQEVHACCKKKPTPSPGKPCECPCPSLKQERQQAEHHEPLAHVLPVITLWLPSSQFESSSPLVQASCLPPKDFKDWQRPPRERLLILQRLLI